MNLNFNTKKIKYSKLERENFEVETLLSQGSTNEFYQGYIIINYLAILGHAISAGVMMGIYLNRTPLQIPYTETYLKWNQLDNITVNNTCQGRRLETRNQGEFCIAATSSVIKGCGDKGDENCGLDLGWLVISFHLLSFFFQLLAALTNWFVEGCCGYKYSEMIAKGTNPLRFIEYGFSAAIMLMCIALINGVTDINLIASIAVLTSATEICGLVVEYLEDIKMKWILHLNGWLLFLCAYGIIAHAYFKAATAVDGISPPDFVYVIVLVLFLLYASFGFVQLIELTCETDFFECYNNERCTKKGDDPCNRCNVSFFPALRVESPPNKKKCNPLYKEMVYVTLSLGAKLVLGWLIFSNVLFSTN